MRSSDQFLMIAVVLVISWAVFESGNISLRRSDK